MIINGEKFACDICIRGHRVAQCKHTDRPLRQISSKGRPVSQCDHCRDLRKTSSVHTRCKCASEALNPATGLARCRCFTGEGCTCAHSKKQPALKDANSMGYGSPMTESGIATPSVSTQDGGANTPQTLPTRTHRPLAMKPALPTPEESGKSCCSSGPKKSCCSSNGKASCCSLNNKASCCSSETVVPYTTCCSTRQPEDSHLTPVHDLLANDAQTNLYNVGPPWALPTGFDSSLDPSMLSLLSGTHLNTEPSDGLDLFGRFSSGQETDALSQIFGWDGKPVDWSSFDFQPTTITDVPEEENQQPHVYPPPF
ncbi:unnamed protein product [Clonostachys chloroleuca]|uniref:Copper-fist domain-containing protein n=1 Tax=Clonostachys chloroleuca TaxID=1926264 RepID=A0AA35Q3X3_9HYPO|nr:unnamed protein product [Clonostachys chloroleuca]